MRHIKTTLIAIIAIGALSAIASATASAATEPQFLPGAGTKYTSKSLAGTLETLKKGSIECTDDKDEGELTSDTTGVITIDFLGCKALSIIGAHSLGDPAGVILFHGTTLLCWINEAKKEAGIYVHVPSPGVHIEIEGVSILLLVTGSVLGSITPVGLKQLAFQVVFEQSKGVQKLKKCTGGQGQTFEGHLETGENGEAAEESGEQTTDEIGFLKVEVEIMTS
jgi:hypothetical protein